jgi:hypothetical protein
VASAPESSAAGSAPVPPQNLDAEESVIGACLLSSVAIDAVAGELDAGDFYRESHARIYRAALSLHQLGQPVDAITVADRLEDQGMLADVGGKQRVHELAALVPATSNAAHYARIVHREARRRALLNAGELLIRRAYESADPDELEQAARELLDDAAGRHDTQPLEGLTHREVLELHLEADRTLVDDLIPAGAVGTIAGVPESHKSWLAQAIAVRVAAGTGTILGRPVVAQGPVGYFWQDDSTREEAERVKAFEAVHNQPADLPLVWYLNQGLQLPRDLPRIRHAVDRHRLVLVVLDSFYNFLGGVDLKEAEAEQIVSQLKRDVCDATGAGVLIVDHMPWATDTNRQRLRAYGGVFKNAATRFGIYIDAAGDKLHIEARGNNIRGIPRTLAAWNPDRLELYLVEHAETVQGDDYEARVLAFLADHPWALTRELEEDIKGKAPELRAARDRLLASGQIASMSSRDLGRQGRGIRWNISNEAEVTQSSLPGTTWDDNHEGGADYDSPRDLRPPTGDHSGHRSRSLEPRQGDAREDASDRTNGSERPLVPTPPPNTVTQLPSNDDPQTEVVPAVGTSRDELSPATQDEVVPGKASPLKGEPSGTTTVGSTQTSRPTTRPDVTEATEWIDQHGWMSPDPTTVLLERWPTLGAHDLRQLLDRAHQLAAAEAGQ